MLKQFRVHEMLSEKKWSSSSLDFQIKHFILLTFECKEAEPWNKYRG